MKPKGQLIQWNLFSVGGGNLKIAASDCHTIGLDGSAQLHTDQACVSVLSLIAVRLPNYHVQHHWNMG